MKTPRFPVLRVVLHLSLGLAQAVALLLLWLGMSAALMLLFECLGAERYAPGDTPHHAFQVLALQADGTPALLFLRDRQPGTPLATQAQQSTPKAGHAFTLTQTAPNVYELRADRDTFISTQRYRIEGQGPGARITPLAFRWRHVMQGLVACIGALPMLWLLRKGLAAARKVLEHQKT